MSRTSSRLFSEAKDWSFVSQTYGKARYDPARIERIGQFWGECITQIGSFQWLSKYFNRLKGASGVLGTSGSRVPRAPGFCLGLSGSIALSRLLFKMLTNFDNRLV